MAKNRKLFSVASEINIGRDTIVDYLVTKGYEIENKPGALLTEEMVKVTMKRFETELENAEKQRKKLLKIKKNNQKIAQEESADNKDDSFDNDFIDFKEAKNKEQKKEKVKGDLPKEIKKKINSKESYIDAEKDKDKDKNSKAKIKIKDHDKKEKSSIKDKRDIISEKDKKDKKRIKRQNDEYTPELIEPKREIKKKNVKEDVSYQEDISVVASDKPKISLTSATGIFTDNLPKVGEVIKVFSSEKDSSTKDKKKDKDKKFKKRDDKENRDEATKKKIEKKLKEDDRKLSKTPISLKKIKENDKNAETETAIRKDKKKKKPIKDKDKPYLPKEEKFEIKVRKRDDSDLKTEDKEIKTDEKAVDKPKPKPKGPPPPPMEDFSVKGLTVLGKLDAIPENVYAGFRYSDFRKPAKNLISRKGGKGRDDRDKRDFKEGDRRDYRYGEKRDFKEGDRRDYRYGEKRDFKEGDRRDYRYGEKRDFKEGDRRDFKEGDRRDYRYGEKRDFKEGDRRDYRYGEKRDFKEGDRRDYRYGEKRDFKEGDRRDYRYGEKRDFKEGDRRDYRYGEKRDFKEGDRRDFREGDRRDYSDRPKGYYHTGGYVRRDGDGRFEKGREGTGFGFRKDRPKLSEYKPFDKLKKVFTDNAPARGTKPTFYDDRKKKGRTLKPFASDVDVDKAIRATLSGMEDTGSSRKAKIKLKKKTEREERFSRRQEFVARESRILRLTEFVTTSDLAALLNIKSSEIILKCMQLGLMVTINQRLDRDTILLIVSDYGLEVEFEEETVIEILDEIVDTEESLLPRPPIVTIMGHVDHGKTSLLDFIRNANVIAGEAGGITQHIGAYRVKLDEEKAITFLDTPGHEAFTAMRARGAQVTDIVVIVVAADDSVMPQTIEAISHARAANVPIIVAINKIDKSEANIDKIKQQLSEQGILVEDWGGKYQCAEISAKKGTNVDILLEKILLEAEMLNLKANPHRKAQGIVIESKMTKGWGNVATVVIQKGTLNIQDNFVAGANYGKIRALLDERGNKVQDVLPSQPVVVIGFDGLPNVGDTFVVVGSEVEAREIANKRTQLRREQAMRKVRFTTLDDISAQISLGGVKDLNLIIKGDVAGSVEALSDSLLKLSTSEVRVNIVLKQAGTITESDVMLAAASNAIIIGFNISSTPQAAKLSEQEQVEIRRYNIIYDCINEIHLALEGMLKPDIKEEIVATIEVRQIFKISKIGQIAGCYVESGKITRNDKIRIIRNGFPLFTGNIVSLKRIKDNVKEVESGYECGIQVGNFNDFEEGDIIEAIKYVEIKRTLELQK